MIIIMIKMIMIIIINENNVVRTNQMKARIDKTQQNSNCRLCGDRDGIIHHIISKCSKLAQKAYKISHDWVGKMIHWKLCKKFNFDHRNKWYTYNRHLLLKISRKLLWEFDIQTLT